MNSVYREISQEEVDYLVEKEVETELIIHMWNKGMDERIKEYTRVAEELMVYGEAYHRSKSRRN